MQIKVTYIHHWAVRLRDSETQCLEAAAKTYKQTQTQAQTWHIVSMEAERQASCNEKMLLLYFLFGSGYQRRVFPLYLSLFLEMPWEKNHKY